MNDPASDVPAFLRRGEPEAGQRPLSPRTVLRLQQTLGNREVVRLLAPPSPPAPGPAIETDALPSASAPLPVLHAPARSPRAPLRVRLVVAWQRVTGTTSAED